MSIIDNYDAGFQNGKNDLALDLINHFDKKIEELKANDNVSNNAHIYAIKSFIKTIKQNLNKDE